ncbi:tyrosine-type recombinase/integrase [Aquella oligotrophica]|uniref:tyrosine-type recombinase/integrase n=1 Tax=Aquella oligotrophica TaxID=2067065 RepID=UPI00131513C3|nr:site-specific integrase [Aquella oligotrophica]
MIGNELVTKITDDFIKQRLLLPKIENNSASVARLILINIKVLIDFAVELKIIEYNPATKIKAVNIYRDKPRTRHLNNNEIKQLLDFVYASNIRTQTKLAVHLSLMLLTRKSELIHATWENVDFEQSRFIINESKMNSQLVIPLPKQASNMFEKLKKLSRGSKYIFPGITQDSPISATNLNWMLRNFNKTIFGNDRQSYVTVHDLRRTGATHLGELGYPSDYIEVALNHSKGGIKQVYQRSQFIEQRKEMLQRWADILDSLIDQEILYHFNMFYDVF